MTRVKITSNTRTSIINVRNQAVYDYLISIGIDAEEAIEADSWCELAVIGEIYDAPTFEIQMLG